jgi:heptosyltransferase-1
LKLLAGNAAEVERARQLSDGFQGAEVVLGLGLTGVAELLVGARMMVGLDSGLTHLSAALGRPTIGIYRASTPVRTPLVGDSFTASLGDRGASPSRDIVLAAVEQALGA